MGNATPGPETSDFNLFWGDLHNHNEVGYAVGSLARTYEIAMEHLDFLAFTPHAQWHDMPSMPENKEQIWVEGFEVTRERWPDVQRMVTDYNSDGEFAAILGYEWHSSGFGHYCVYSESDRMPLPKFDHVLHLQNYARETNALLIPHHLAYKQGWAGANWEYLDTKLSPVIEIYSYHGLAETDVGPNDFVRQSTGGRWTRNTLQRALGLGYRVGVIASTDDHLGYPGAYGEGLAGAFAPELTRDGILAALRNRRTIAVTGDRIHLEVSLNDSFMGTELPFDSEREIRIRAVGQDEIKSVEILRNNRVVHRHFPIDNFIQGPWAGGEFLARLEFGWGPWSNLELSRTCDWDVTVRAHGAEILAVTPCFQSGPYDEHRRDRIVHKSQDDVRFQIHTSRAQAFQDRATKSVILRVLATPQARLELSAHTPKSMTVGHTFQELFTDNEIHFIGNFPSESFLIHRLVKQDLFRTEVHFIDQGTRGSTDCYYVRVTQANGHQAWSSPIWVEG